MPTKKDKKSQLNPYLKYSGLVFQLGLIIGLFTFLGQWLDKKMEMETPWYTVVFSLSGVGLGLYTSLKGILKNES